MVGTDAKRIQELPKPTMVLNLKDYSSALQEGIVLHEFGRAFGLENEHQRPDFWKEIEPFIDIENMKKLVGGESAFNRDWYMRSDIQRVNSLSKYDPESIMHYR